jgi:flagellar hook protein FlgE
MQANLRRLDGAANDIANVNSIGFRGEFARGQAGALISTGNPLDLALEGDAWFRVASWNGSAFGEVLYTRAGNFHRDANGSVVTSDGRYAIGYALDAAGKPTQVETPIKLPQGTVSFSVGEDGIVTATDAPGQTTKVAALSLARFANPGGLSPAGSGLYRATGDSGPEQAGAFGGIASGALETSNVDLAGSIVDTFVAKNGFTASARVFDTASSVLEELVRLGRR